MFDRKIHRLRLQRAAHFFQEGNGFLMRLSADDMIERLSLVNRDFDDAAVLFGRTPYAANVLQQSGKVKTILRVEDEFAVGKGDAIADPTLLKLEANSLDLVVAPLALHWSNDLPGTMIQVNRALRPNGLMLASLPGPDTLFELRQSLLQAESDINGGAANRIDAFTDIRDAGALLQRAGFSLPVIDQENFIVRYDTALDLIRDLRNFGATLHLAQPKNPPLTRAVIARMVEIYADKFSDSDGRIRATFNFVSLSGWSPHKSQQKPLKPGAAQVRLADALKTDEIKLKD